MESAIQTSIHGGIAPRISIASVRQWREAILQGNRAFQIADYIRAVGHYRVACSIAEEHFGSEIEADQGVALLVIACLNLADSFEQLDCVAEQGAQLCAIHEKLCLAMNEPAFDETWRMAVWQHSRRTYAELSRFVKRHPADERARAVLGLGAAGPETELCRQ